MQTSTRYIALIIGLAVLTLGLTACGDSPTRAEFDASQAEIQTLRAELTTANNRIAVLEKFSNVTRDFACYSQPESYRLKACSDNRTVSWGTEQDK